MNSHLTILEDAVVALGLVVLLLDLWIPAGERRKLGCLAAVGLGLILAGSFWFHGGTPQYAFHGMYVLDSLALFFKRFFLIAAIIVLIMSVEFADCISSGI